MAPATSGPAVGLVIFAKDLGALASFYEHVLSLDVVEGDDTYVVLQAGGIELVVLQVPEHIGASITITAPPAVREDTALKPVFNVANLTALGAVVAANGGCLKPPEAQWRFRGTTVLDGWDPEGNVVQFRQRDD